MQVSRTFSTTLKTLILCTLCTPLAAQEGDGWHLWSDRTQLPPDELLFGLPIVPTGENSVAVSAETEDSPTDINLNETIEKDGQPYKALQFSRDAHYEVTVPTNTYLIGVLGAFYPNDSVDPIAYMKTLNLVSVEIDGIEIPIDESFLVRREEFPVEGFVLGAYNVFPLFTTPGKHTYVQTYQQTEPFFMTIPFDAMSAAFGAEDPSPEFEGRRVYMPERVGDPVDGKVVFSYDLTVEDAPTAIAEDSWGAIKQTIIGPSLQD